MYKTGLIAMTILSISTVAALGQGGYAARHGSDDLDTSVILRRLENDPAGQEGLAFLTAHMLTEASTLKTVMIKSAKIISMAAVIPPGDKELTVIEGGCTRTNGRTIIHCSARRCWNRHSRRRILNAFRRDAELSGNVLRFSNDEELGKQVLNQFIFSGTPYGHPKRD